MTIRELIEVLEDIEREYGNDVSIMFDSKKCTAMIAGVTVEYVPTDDDFIAVLHPEK